jgi:hypothetical protein
MWEWLSTNWTTLLVALVALACPLMLFTGGHSHPRRSQRRREGGGP